MSKFLKIFMFVMMMAFLPTKHYAQFSQVNDNEPTISFDITDISLFDERVFFLYNLANDSRFDVVNSEQDGIFIVSVNEAFDGIELQEAFADFREQNAQQFALLDKEQAAEIAMEYKSLLPGEFALSLMMDIYSRDRQNNTCANADPFCTDNGLYEFPAGVNAGSGEAGPYYDCLSTRPNPAWYYMRILNPGSIDIYMYSTPSVDIDFCCWGPFTDPTTPCPNGLTSNKVVSCSYAAAHTEHCLIPSTAQTGEYYILVITNFSNQATNISFSKVAGTGTTDCGILPPLVNNSGPYCVGETINLTANGQAGATYSWTGPANFNSNQQNPTRPNCTMNMAGTYTCTIAVGSQTNSATTDVVIYPMPTANFNFTSVCVGNATQFTSTSTTNPSGQQISSFNWNFGDGQTGQGQTVTHTYARAGTFQATLTVSTGGHCTSQITKTVTVYDLPSCGFTYTTVCQGSPTQFSSTATSAPGNPITSYQWNFGDGQTGQGQTVSHTYAQAGTYQVTHTVQTNGSCSNQRIQSVPVNAQPTPTASATPNIIIYGGTAQLTANAGSQGSYNFHWEPANKVVNPNSQTTQTVQLYETTAFTCTVTNPQGSCSGSTQVTVAIEGSNMTATATADQNVLCEGESTTLHAQPAGGTGNYTYSWTPANTLNNPSIQNPTATPPLGTTTYTCQVNDGLSTQNVSVSITVHPHVESDISVSICPDDTYDFFGVPLSQEGNYEHTIESHLGCDSTIHLHLNHYETYETPITRHFCQGDTYTFFGNELNGAGIYFHTLESIHGCDSVIRLNLIEDPSYTFYPVESTCEGGPGYLFDGQYLQPRPEPYTFNYQTTAGCDSIYIIQINESEYNSKNYNISICDTQYTWPSNGQTYYETGMYFDTLHYENSCDSTLILNLTLRHTTDTLVSITSCDDYTWISSYFGVNETFYSSHYETYEYTNEENCPSHVTLDLTINNFETHVQLPYDDFIEYTGVIGCDSALWSNHGHSYTTQDIYDPESHWYTLSAPTNDPYKRTYQNHLECDSIVTFPLLLEYTPGPTEIYPVDYSNTTPHWVVTATEFQINSYDFGIYEESHPVTCHWDSIVWKFENPNVLWLLEPDTTTNPAGKHCKMYVLNYIQDTVWLDAIIYNKCSPEGITQRYWFVCSFYGVEEQQENTADFSVVPNPNNGMMTINFEQLTGKIDLKVYDMKGTLIDHLTTNSIGGPEKLQYNMQHRSEGIYFFVATGKEGTVAKKVIIKR